MTDVNNMPAHPAYTPEEANTRQTFLALMWSLSYPGRVYELPAAGMEAFHAVADTLLDLETSYFCPQDELAGYLARSGARALPAADASYHFYPQVTVELLPVIETASIGTLLYPDHSATLLLGCTLGAGLVFELTGPGISPVGPPTIQVDGLPDAFWELRAKANRYPRGWDVYLIAGNQIIGLPRTTQITRQNG